MDNNSRVPKLLQDLAAKVAKGTHQHHDTVGAVGYLRDGDGLHLKHHGDHRAANSRHVADAPLLHPRLLPDLFPTAISKHDHRAAEGEGEEEQPKDIRIILY